MNLMFFKKAKLDEYYSNECIYCGETIIDWSYKIIQNDIDIFKLN